MPFSLNWEPKGTPPKAKSSAPADNEARAGDEEMTGDNPSSGTTGQPPWVKAPPADMSERPLSLVEVGARPEDMGFWATQADARVDADPYERG